jgi:hypothetical protein
MKKIFGIVVLCVILAACATQNVKAKGDERFQLQYRGSLGGGSNNYHDNNRTFEVIKDSNTGECFVVMYNWGTSNGGYAMEKSDKACQ